MKIIIVALLVIGNLTGCTDGQTQGNQNSSITAENISDEILKQVKHYPIEPMYVISHEGNYCYYEIFIDDIPVFKNFDNMAPEGFDINKVIFKSGKHTLKYKLYPFGNQNKYKQNYPTLTDETSLNLKLGSYDLKNDEASDKILMEYSLPTTKNEVTKGYVKQNFIGAGKTFYEGSVDINVTVPYQTQSPFENAQDLRKMDEKVLEAKLLKKYKEISSIYGNGDQDNIAKLEYNSLKDMYVSTYESRENVSKNINTLFKEVYKNSSFEMQPLKKYKLSYFAGGKLAALMLDTNDNQLRGNTALWAKVNDGQGTRAIFLNRYFYIPARETEFKVY
ncbi:hypothetical protein ACUN24_20640 [Pedobacter sp. WC2501]|uniref:hypothetical protein n=1 Tax=Pedobacter sp. WC2501 TaxID=3461400 RepID=UPI004045EB56